MIEMDNFKPIIKQERFETIEDLLTAYYGPTSDYMMKAAPILTSTGTGNWNTFYGPKLWAEIAYASNTFGALPKKPWDHSGYRTITVAAATATSGVAEPGSLPATLKPTFAAVAVGAKTLIQTYEMSLQAILTEGKDDTVKWSDIMEYMSAEFRNRADRQLYITVHTTTAVSLESLDRICSASTEVTSETLDTHDADVYGYAGSGLNRDGSTVYDAYVNSNTATDRVLSLSLIDSLVTNCAPYWSSASYDSKLFTTKFDTLERWEQLLQPQQRFGDKQVSFGVNGVQTLRGAEAGFDVATYKGIPIIPDAYCTADTLGRVFLMDLDRLHIGILSPPQHIENEDFVAQGQLARKAVDYMLGETIATGFHCHGKLIDLK